MTLTLTAVACDPAEEDAEGSVLLADEDDDDAVSSPDQFATRDRKPGEPDELEMPDAVPLAGPDDFQAPLPEESTSQLMWHHTWNQGQGSVWMGSTTDRFCFLTKVQGNFEGAGEAVWAFKSGGNWYLGGTSAQSGVSANATCIPTNYWGQTLVVSQEYGWFQGSPSVNMGLESGRVCFLTRVSGEFQGAGETVAAFTAYGYWYLGGQSQASEVSAFARCVNTGYRKGPYYSGPVEDSVRVQHSDYWACGLTEVGGDFASAADWLLSWIDVDGYWRFAAHATLWGVEGVTYCL